MIPIIEWGQANGPKEDLIYGKGVWEQISFAKDIHRLLEPEYKIQSAAPPLVISTHTSKSVLLPVWRIRTSYGLVVTCRDNFHNLKFSIQSQRPINADFHGICKIDEQINTVYCEGFENEWVYGPYANDNEKFTVEIFGTYPAWTFFFLLKRDIFDGDRLEDAVPAW